MKTLKPCYACPVEDSCALYIGTADNCKAFRRWACAGKSSEIAPKRKKRRPVHDAVFHEEGHCTDGVNNYRLIGPGGWW
jgi:hypothetical protein